MHARTILNTNITMLISSCINYLIEYFKINWQGTVEEKVENNEQNLDICQRQTNHDLNMLQKGVGVAMEQN